MSKSKIQMSKREFTVARVHIILMVSILDFGHLDFFGI